MKRQIILDTETTGLEPSEGHRIIEVGCVEMVNRRLTGNDYWQYIQPDRIIDQGAFEVHGISNESLADKPRFEAIADPLINYLKGAELVIHNAPFDVGFLDYEFARMGKNVKIADICTVVDTLQMAKKKHPGQRNNLDALCRRYGIDNSHRDLHGALLDAQILADVYLFMTGGQVNLFQDSLDNKAQSATKKPRPAELTLSTITASDADLTRHHDFLRDVVLKGQENQKLW